MPVLQHCRPQRTFQKQTLQHQLMQHAQPIQQHMPHGIRADAATHPTTNAVACSTANTTAGATTNPATSTYTAATVCLSLPDPTTVTTLHSPMPLMPSVASADT